MPDARQPVRLAPVHIAKPWGQEIWFTGMEARGESRVCLDDETDMGIASYLAQDPAALCGNNDVLLLKILDPAPAPVTGDLYFEVHEEKREVYVVTAVDTDAWPDGVGAIRFGMCQDARARSGDDAAFRAAYLQAVQDYEAVRRDIDERGANRDADERAARERMDAFTALTPLRVGDVVKVPVWTPHALQHGVRVVEFQTPTYERLIVSFAQQVVTQDHWDSAAAVARMHLDTPAPPEFEAVSPGVERIARFDHFNVWRVRNVPNLALPQHLPYAVCMGVSGTTTVQAGADTRPLTLSAEQACFVPHDAVGSTHLAAPDATLLIAAPEL